MTRTQNGQITYTYTCSDDSGEDHYVEDEISDSVTVRLLPVMQER